ncbi:hypothetical protein [Commensalibacter papalotli (ex Botero et al. 2024)]|uniref:hypothetical protein n=1 Tax=Commensalibacter papalotli (ex Botero et al. 2024) TaxID=2972766 RepID=UPI0022FFB1CA|nr:hypothetical protein [Commensalibacter papalotli (ex Botero et al. 2024)]CAI3926001.1 unnamed protein product [Commensalibacter papalotli (ex Botero et al. 2024)]
MSKTKQQCGIIMPISTIDGCHESHWSEVLSILKEVIESSGLKGDVVSYADEVGIIQKRIIDNLYHNPIIICDVSGKNPNVMFELGMRLAFDKPTIIIKDDCTSYSFDTSPIEHLEYPRDLNYIKINAFKERLVGKIKTQLEAINKKGAYSPFLKHFGEFTVAKLDQKEVSGQDYIVEQLGEISKKIGTLERGFSTDRILTQSISKYSASCIKAKKVSDKDLLRLITELESLGIRVSDVKSRRDGQQDLCFSSFMYDPSVIDLIVDSILIIIEKEKK